MTTQTKIADLLRQAIGFDVATVGRSMIEHALGARMAACRAGNLEDYLQQLRDSKSELQELIENVVVPETWFFRDWESFTALAKIAVNEWSPAHSTAVLRLLSMPCSSGEEPYSMAMALLDAGLAPARFEIDAADISARALALAERATYGKNSFRNKDLDFRDRYFHATPDGYRLAEPVRARVRFQQANLLAADFFAGAKCYDIIFCRNVLIYFDAPTQELVIKKLERLLSPDGLLFVGPSEAFAVLGSGLISANRTRAFAYRKRGAPANGSVRRSELPRKKDRKITPRSVPKSSTRKRAEKIHPAAPAPAPEKPPSDLKTARGLADAGRLSEAATACETHLREQGASADGYCLLGVVFDALGDQSHAADCYRKALYLQPSHPDALTHLSLLTEKRGDIPGARRLQLRARRVEEVAVR